MNLFSVQSLRSAIFGVATFASLALLSSTAIAALNCNQPQCVERRLTSSDNVTIVAQDWGAKYPNRPTLLLIHGYPHSHDAFVKQIKSELRRKYRLITMDLRGMGESDKPTDPNQYISPLLAEDVDRVLNAFGIQSVVLVAHSYGAAAAIPYMIIKGTSKVAGFVAVAPAHAGVSGLNVTPEALDLFISQFEPPSYPAFIQSNKDFITMSYAPQKAPKGEAKNLLAVDLLVPPLTRSAILLAPAVAPPEFVEGFLSGLVTTNGVKTLFIYGEEDKVLIPQSFEDLHNLVVGSEIIGYPNQGHLLMLSNKEIFNRDLMNFVDSLHLGGSDYDNEDYDDDE